MKQKTKDNQNYRVTITIREGNRITLLHSKPFRRYKQAFKECQRWARFDDIVAQIEDLREPKSSCTP